MSGSGCEIEGDESCPDNTFPATEFAGFFDDDGVEGADDDEEWVMPAESGSEKPKSKSVKLEWSDTRAYIRSLVEEMDFRRLSIRDAHHLLVAMFIKGGGNPEDQCISYGSVERIIDEVRAEADARAKEQEFPERGVVHFDGVKVTLGAKHGNRRVEHVAVTVTGLGKEHHIGIFEVSNGTGNDVIFFAFLFD